MKNIRKWFILVLIMANVTVLSGCQVFMLPVYVVGGTFAVLGALLPVALRLAPLALLVVQVEDDESAQDMMVAQADISDMVASSKSVPLDALSENQDGFVLIESVVRKNDGAERKKLLIFAYDTNLPVEIVAQEIQSRLPAGQIVKVDSHVVNGASFWNQKYRFFSLLDTLKEQGIPFHAVGLLKESTELINSTADRS